MPALLRAQTTPEQKQRLEQREREAIWEQCREVWWDGKEKLTDVEKRLLFMNFHAGRDLTAKQKQCILIVSDWLLEDKTDSRYFTPKWFGDMGHSYCIPPLLAVLRDEADNKTVRAGCAFALSRIPDYRAVDALIDTLSDRDPWLAKGAWGGLLVLVGFDSLGLHPEPPPPPGIEISAWRDDLKLEWRKQTQAKFRAWWKENQDHTVLWRHPSSQAGLGGVPAESLKDCEQSADAARGCRKLWEDCKEVWFEGQEHLSAAEKRKLFEKLAADRKLSANQQDCILLMWDRLLDKTFPCRCEIPGWLGDMGHAYCLPPLLAVLRDKAEPAALRSRCLRAISSIGDPRSAEALIDTFGDENPDVARAADEGLAAMLGSFYPEKLDATLPRLGAEPKEEEALRWRNARRDKYRAWWQQNRDRVKLSRANVVGGEEDTGEPMRP